MKRLFILATLSLIIITNVIYSQNVDIKTNFPSKVQQSQEFEIKIIINKGEISGFARLQLDFPEGFTVKSSQLQGATFSYKENKARFLWMALPTEGEITVNCMVTVPNSVSGNQEFEGAFSYVLNNETQKIIIPKSSINIEGAGLIVSNEIKTESINENSKENISSEDAEKLEAERKARELAIAKAEKEKLDREEQEKRIKEEAAVKAKEEELAKEEAEKNEAEKNALNNKNEEVVVSNNGENERIEQEKIEQERKAKEEAQVIAEEEERLAKIKENEEAEKNALNNKNEEVVVSNNEENEKIEQERIAREEAAAQAEKERLAREAEEERLAQIQKEEEQTIENNKTIENNVVVENIDVVENNDLELKAKEEEKAKFEKERLAKEEADRLEKERYAKEIAIKSKESENLSNNTNVNKAVISSNIDFRIQVGASRQVADKGYYSRLNISITEFNVVENSGDDGWFRYTIGSFTNISSAQNLLPKVKQQGFEGFVVAFKDGKRITIQEAKKLLGQ